LAMEDVPDYVSAAYGVSYMHYGSDYVIPKPVDHRVLLREAVAVARAAHESGVAKKPIEDYDEYRNKLERLLGKGRHVTRMFIEKARVSPKRIIFTEGDHPKILRASALVIKERIGQPILIGSHEKIKTRAEELGISLDGMKVIDPWQLPNDELQALAQDLWQHRQRKGVTCREAERLLRNPNYLGIMLLRHKKADALVAGVSQHYSDIIRPALQLLPKKPGVRNVSALFALVFKNRNLYLADVGVNIDANTKEDLAEIAILAADTVRKDFMCEPRVAMISFSNFGSVPHPLSRKIADTVKLVKELRPDIIIDGEMQADTAVSESLLQTTYKFSSLDGEAANTLIFPDMTSANIAYKLLTQFGGATAIGPIIMGMAKSVHIVQNDCSASDIVQMAAFATVDANN
jgi:malate dehydrogenase (oxaloacetate-decarboxylating)(NADP+)